MCITWFIHQQLFLGTKLKENYTLGGGGGGGGTRTKILHAAGLEIW
jgi:hypothetical protein